MKNNMHHSLSNFPGGFLPKMTDYEAKLILGIEEEKKLTS